MCEKRRLQYNSKQLEISGTPKPSNLCCGAALFSSVLATLLFLIHGMPESNQKEVYGGFPQIRVPIRRVTAFGDLYWGPLFMETIINLHGAYVTRSALHQV